MEIFKRKDSNVEQVPNSQVQLKVQFTQIQMN